MRRLRGLRVLWGVVMGCVVLGAVASVPLAFIVCANFSDEYMREFCPPQYRTSVLEMRGEVW